MSLIATIEPKESIAPAVNEPVARAQAAPLLWLLALQVPLWMMYGNHLWERPHYQFYPLAVAAAVFMIGFRLRRDINLYAGSRRFTALLVMTGLALEALALLIHSYWLIGLTLPLAAITFLYAVGGWRCVFRSWTAVALLALCIPLPFRFDWQMVSGLRDLTSTLGSEVLNFFRLPHLRNGNVLEVGGRSLFVAEACSGVNSLFSSLCCVLVWAGFMRVHWVQTLLLLVAAVFWLIVANSLRVIVVAMGVAWWNIDLATGLQHEALGVLTFALGLFLTWNTQQLISFFVTPRA